ncbi:hypothetical protein BDR07DRAFT_1486046 [Suillus spraguei]|nr:hypothetical protein BDR07DRAFT_1486046 [Suillus spraguei]
MTIYLSGSTDQGLLGLALSVQRMESTDVTAVWSMDWGFFKDTSLIKIRLEIHLGHQGVPCPKATEEWYNTDDEGEYFTKGP